MGRWRWALPVPSPTSFASSPKRTFSYLPQGSSRHWPPAAKEPRALPPRALLYIAISLVDGSILRHDRAVAPSKVETDLDDALVLLDVDGAERGAAWSDERVSAGAEGVIVI